MPNEVIHWERLSFGTLIMLGAVQQADPGPEQFLFLAYAIDPLIDGPSIIARPIAEAHAIIEAFAAEGKTTIPALLARLIAVPAQLPAPAAVKDTATYTAQPGDDRARN